jgi:RNA 3'-phosphate cyclase
MAKSEGAENLIAINGAYLEGGGQIARTAIGLAALLTRPIRITGIRRGRPSPGLKMQHLTAINCAKAICSAEVVGNRLHSEELVFKPREKPRQLALSANISTAGSISLVLQTIMLPAMLVETRLRITGGTNVEWSPPIEFMQQLLFSLLKKMGARFELRIGKRGYYPMGKGIVNFSSRKARLPLRPISLTELGDIDSIRVFSHSSNLPHEVSVNQARSAKKVLLQRLPRISFDEKIESKKPSDAIGSGITLIAVDSDGNMLAASALGKQGKPAETVGKEAAQKLLQELAPAKAVDSHTADQLIPFMALAEGYSTIQCSKLTRHCLTNISVCETMVGVKFDVRGKLGGPAEIFVEGAGFT